MTEPRTQAGCDHVAAWIDVADMTEAVLAIEAEARDLILGELLTVGVTLPPILLAHLAALRRGDATEAGPGGTLHRTWHVSTGGWSGHEDVISALRDNLMFWMLSWVSSTRGGHYVFETREAA